MCESSKESEKALLHLKNEMAAILENIDNGFFSLDKDWQFAFINSKAAKNVGYEAKDLIGKNIWEKFPKIIGTDAETNYRRVMRERVNLQFQTYGAITNRWYEEKVYPTPEGLAIYWRDITENKKAEDALKESEEKFRNLAEESPNMIFINQGGRVVYVNKKSEDILGYTRDEFYSPTFNFFSLIPHEYVEEVKQASAKHLKGEDVPPYEYVLIGRKGKRVDAIIATKLIDFMGKKAVMGIVTDITERKKAEKKLEQNSKNLKKLVEERTEEMRKSEQSYRELYESFDEAFIATDWELNVIHWNKAAERITTVSAKDALGKKIYAVLPEMSSVDVTSFYKDLQEKKPVRFMMNSISRQTGQNATFEISTYPSSLGIIVIVEDKTKEEETKRLSIIGQTASMVGHDIRNPLQAITSDLYLLREELQDIPKGENRQEMQESIDSIDVNIAYINKIVSDLQDYTRQLKPGLEKVNLKDLIESTLTDVNVPERIKTEVIVEDHLALNTDVAYLRRILTNLSINAVQAMPDRGKLIIEACTKKGRIVICVKDTGIGIPEEVKPNVFKPLFTTKSKGQGLGLAVVKRLVEGLNGKVSFESKIGYGTGFTIEFPVL